MFYKHFDKLLDMKNKLILITGGSASGKTHLAKELAKHFGSRAIFLSQDSFYKPGGGHDRNYDEPAAFDFEKQKQVLKELLDNKETTLPVYDFAKHDVVGSTPIKPAEYIIFEGLFTFYDYELSKLADFKIFVDTPADTRLARRIMRDVKERGRDVEEVINRWLKDVQPSYREFISPMKRYADVIIPWHKLKERAIKSIVVTISHLDVPIDKLLEEAQKNNL